MKKIMFYSVLTLLFIVSAVAQPTQPLRGGGMGQQGQVGRGQQNPQWRNPGFGQPRLEMFLKEQVGFNEKQMENFEKAFVQHRDKMKMLFRAVEDKEDIVADLLRAKKPDEVKVKSALKDVTVAQSSLEESRVSFLFEVLKLAETDAQKEAITDFMSVQAQRRMPMRNGGYGRGRGMMRAY
ncbi:MAG: periplasmic heavy metal sensor [Chloroherpetonaceae bacterium]|nr:periplasmic heavy metal sensor [Chloroherpetonaceae bacterium]